MGHVVESDDGGSTVLEVAWGEAAKWILGSTLTQPCAATSSDATTYTCSYSRKDGYTAEAIWNTTSTEVVTVPKQYIQYRDVTGWRARHLGKRLRSQPLRFSWKLKALFRPT